VCVFIEENILGVDTMKIDRNRLVELVVEEVERIRNERLGTDWKKVRAHYSTPKGVKTLEEIDRLTAEDLLRDYNPLHNPQTGKFQAKGKGKAVYSLTQNAKKVVGKDTKVPNRGITTNDGESVSAKYGMNTSSPEKACGRKTIGGDKKKKTRRCRDYPKNYWVEGLEGLVEELCSLDEGANKEICDRCIQGFLARLRKANAALKAAADGKELEESADQEEKKHYQGSPIDKRTRKTAKRAQGERRKKLRRDAGVYVEPFSRAEKSLLNPNLVEMATGKPILKH